jgi:hypothetical protein
MQLVNPFDEARREAGQAPPRLDTLRGKAIALLDISKPGGSVFLDRVEHLLVERYGVARVVREAKPTFTKPAPPEVLNRIHRAQVHAVIEALAD